MTKPHKKYPDVRALFPRFEAYALATNSVWGRGMPLYWALSKHPECPGAVCDDALRVYADDPEGLALYEIACELSVTQRDKLGLMLERAAAQRSGRATQSNAEPSEG